MAEIFNAPDLSVKLVRLAGEVNFEFETEVGADLSLNVMSSQLEEFLTENIRLLLNTLTDEFVAVTSHTRASVSHRPIFGTAA